ncbi:MAG TPA: [FeFe] hydrogenase H-cluster radical SAM maturase HydE, partial [Bacteroidales bacterium]|nr:[FeFe] hydrogenase H-cluster radical SAM maturase HydE [Bacteroidales bacterium]
MQNLIDKLVSKRLLSKEEFVVLIEKRNADVAEYLFRQARQVREKNYGKDVYIRGLIELSNYCKNDCLYCGIRKSNAHVSRYRLDKASILDCCKRGHDLGFRTFVLQGGEDAYYNDKLMVDIISTIKKLYSDSAVTLSLGEKKKETYLAYYQAGADRYLLRHETANAEHYSLLHPKNMSSETRKKCLYDLKEIGFQVGSGFMVGSPYQTVEHLAEDLLFLSDLQPHMIGI